MVLPKESAALERQLPQNIRAEEMLLGAILINPNLFEQIGDMLLPEHFIDKLHSLIFGAIIALNEKAMIPSPITIHAMIERDQICANMDVMQYLLKLTTFSMTVINAKDYANIIYDSAIKRKLILIGEGIVNNAYDANITESSTQQLEEAENQLYLLANERGKEGGFVHMQSPIAEALTKIDRARKNNSNIVGIPTGLIDLDNMLSGFNNSDLIIVAGRPGMGKTAVALNFAWHAAQFLKRSTPDGSIPGSVGFFSLEMAADQLAARLLSMEAEIDAHLLRTGKNLSEEQYNNLRKATVTLGDLSFFIDDTPALSIAAIRSRARKLKRRHNLGILFVDYLQLLRGANKSENRVQEISEITQGLKAIAKELNIPVIALAQLSRAVEQREDKRPLLSDLRESGSIEQDADIVLFLYREIYYLMRREPSQDEAGRSEWLQKKIDKEKMIEIIVAKHRHGQIGKIEAYFEDSLSKMRDLEKKHKIEE
jgi:replicative DNA helicase